MATAAKLGEKWGRANGRPIYPVMTTEDICKMPVGKLFGKNSIMLMWATYPMLPDALRVMAAWNFEFKTVAFTWVKLNPSGVGWHFGLGYHTHGNPEIVLLGTRGNGLSRMDNAIANLIIYPRGKHSAKPPILRGKIERLYGDVNRVELFAREQVKNWSCWGNEVEPSAGTEALWPYIIPPYTAILDEDEHQGLPVVDTLQASYDNGEQIRLM
jgi:N6-adenosine-specific RNA methylase IME4